MKTMACISGRVTRWMGIILMVGPAAAFLPSPCMARLGARASSAASISLPVRSIISHHRQSRLRRSGVFSLNAQEQSPTQPLEQVCQVCMDQLSAWLFSRLPLNLSQSICLFCHCWECLYEPGTCECRGVCV